MLYLLLIPNRYACASASLESPNLLKESYFPSGSDQLQSSKNTNVEVDREFVYSTFKLRVKSLRRNPLKLFLRIPFYANSSG